MLEVRTRALPIWLLPLRDDSTNLECHCEGHRCGCTGEGEDCDEYSQGWFLRWGVGKRVVTTPSGIQTDDARGPSRSEPQD